MTWKERVHTRWWKLRKLVMKGSGSKEKLELGNGGNRISYINLKVWFFFQKKMGSHWKLWVVKCIIRMLRKYILGTLYILSNLIISLPVVEYLSLAYRRNWTISFHSSQWCLSSIVYLSASILSLQRGFFWQPHINFFFYGVKNRKI